MICVPIRLNVILNNEGKRKFWRIIQRIGFVNWLVFKQEQDVKIFCANIFEIINNNVSVRGVD